MTDPVTQFARFCTLLRGRLKKGHEEYGGESFHAPPLRLIQELKEEVLDIANWGFILHSRLEEMERKISALDWEEETDGIG